MTWSRKGISVVFGGFLVHLTLGTLYTFGNMSPYMASYLRKRNYPGIKASHLVWINAATVCGQGLSMVLGGCMEKKHGPLLTTMLGAFTMSAGTLLTYFSIDSTLPMLVFTYGVMYGVGIGIGYISPLCCGMKWFPNRKGLVNGVIVGGFGMGALIFNFVQTAFLNPKNLPANSEGIFEQEEILNKVPYVFLLLGMIYSIMQVVGCLMLSDPQHTSEEITPLRKAGYYGESVSVPETPILLSCETSKFEMSNQHFKCSMTPSQMLKERDFYLLWFSMLFITQTVTFLNSMYKAFGQTFISNDLFLAMVGSISALVNSLGRVVWGTLSDRFGYKKCMVVECTLTCMLISTHSLVPSGGQPAFAAWMWMLSLSLAGTFVLIPTVTTRIFGPIHAGTNYGIVFTNAVVSGPLTAFLTQHLEKTFGFDGLFYLLAGFLAISFLLTMAVREKCRSCGN